MRYAALPIALVLLSMAQHLLSPGAAHGRSTTSQLQAAAIILGKGNCSFVTPGPYVINFSPLDPFSATDQFANVTFSVNGRVRITSRENSPAAAASIAATAMPWAAKDSTK